MTEWGKLSISKRGRYYYAVKTINRIKRQVYLGTFIPSQERLEEVADEINLPTQQWLKLHPCIDEKRKQKSLTWLGTEDTSFVSTLVNHLNRIEALAKCRGEDDIASKVKELRRWIDTNHP